jgi:PAS domain S-box-containing protein
MPDQTLITKQSHEELEAILRAVTDGITVLSPQGQFIYANAAGAKLCGFETVEAFLATPTQQIMDAFEIMDEHNVPFPHDKLPGRLALQGVLNPPETLVKVRVKESGKISWSIINASPVFDDTGKVKYAISIFRDFTKRKQTEDALRLQAEAGTVFAASLDYKVTLQSIADLVVPAIADWCSISVRESQNEFPKSIAVAHIDPAKVSWAAELQKEYPTDWESERGSGQVLRTGKSEIYKEVPDELLVLSSKDENHLRIIRQIGLKSCVIVPLKARRGILGTLTLIYAESGRRYSEDDVRIAEDLASRAAMAVENALLYKESQDAVRMRDEFLSVASHELRTPLTSLRLQAQMNKRNIAKGNVGALAPEKLTKLIDGFDRQSSRLIRLVDDMLDISRINKSKLKLEREKIELNKVIEEVLDRLEDQLIHAKCTVHTTLESVTGYWDRSRIEQVATNLLTNAIKYGPGKPVNISLSSAHNHVVFTVHDSGIGIAKKDHERIFEKFERAVSSNETSGLGLGLYITREIVNLHGGSIAVKSEPGHGSTFTVTIPHTSFN